MKHVNRVFSLVMAVMVLFIFSACQSTSASTTTQGTSAGTAAESTVAPTSASGETTAEKTFTADELKKYDGKNGNRAYVAVDGKVYDLTDVPQWRNGQHNGYTAGKDLTDIIKNKSPHGLSVLKDVPVVGTYTGK